MVSMSLKQELENLGFKVLGFWCINGSNYAYEVAHKSAGKLFIYKIGSTVYWKIYGENGLHGEAPYEMFCEYFDGERRKFEVREIIKSIKIHNKYFSNS